MKKCRRLEKCPFFNDIMSNMPAESEEIKQKYCFDQSEHCARKIIADKFGPENVPDDLFPNENYRAVELINLMANAKKTRSSN